MLALIYLRNVTFFVDIHMSSFMNRTDSLRSIVPTSSALFGKDPKRGLRGHLWLSTSDQGLEQSKADVRCVISNSSVCEPTFSVAIGIVESFRHFESTWVER